MSSLADKRRNLVRRSQFLIVAYTQIEDAGIFTAAGEENGSEAKLSQIREFAKGL